MRLEANGAGVWLDPEEVILVAKTEDFVWNATGQDSIPEPQRMRRLKLNELMQENGALLDKTAAFKIGTLSLMASGLYHRNYQLASEQYEYTCEANDLKLSSKTGYLEKLDQIMAEDGRQCLSAKHFGEKILELVGNPYITNTSTNSSV